MAVLYVIVFVFFLFSSVLMPMCVVVFFFRFTVLRTFLVYTYFKNGGREETMKTTSLDCKTILRSVESEGR